MENEKRTLKKNMTKTSKINKEPTRTRKHLVRKRTLNHLAKLAIYRVWIHSEKRTWHVRTYS